MPWVRLDDHFDEHPKVASLSDAALALWVTSIAYSNRNLTDGFIPEQVGLGKLRYCEGNTVPPIRELERAGLWEEVDGGWRIHDFGEYQPSRTDVETRRADLHDKRSAAGRKGAEKRWGKATTESPGQGGTHDKPSGKPEAKDMAKPKQPDSPVPVPVPVPVSDPVPQPSDESVVAIDRDSRGESSSPPAALNGRNPYYDAVCIALDMPARGPHEGMFGRIAAKAKQDGHDPEEIPRRVALHLATFDFPVTPGSLLKRWDELGSKVVTATPAERKQIQKQVERYHRQLQLQGGN